MYVCMHMCVCVCVCINILNPVSDLIWNISTMQMRKSRARELFFFSIIKINGKLLIVCDLDRSMTGENIFWSIFELGVLSVSSKTWVDVNLQSHFRFGKSRKAEKIMLLTSHFYTNWDIVYMLFRGNKLKDPFIITPQRTHTQWTRNKKHRRYIDQLSTQRATMRRSASKKTFKSLERQSAYIE